MLKKKLILLGKTLRNLTQKKKRADTGDDGLSFLQHLEELRGRLMICIGSVVVLSIPCGIYWRKIFDVVLIYPLRFTNPRPHIIFTAPAEAMMLSMEIAVVSGVIIASPIIFYQLWKFISPGLYGHEKRFVLPIVISTTFSFFLGIAFSYVIIPLMIRVLATFGAGVLEPYFKAQEYIGFVVKMSLACGLIFELPVIAYVLTKMGVLTPQFLIDKLRHAIVVIFIVAAILTPPDVVSQIVLAAPLLVLYGISIVVSALTVRKKQS
jgi:sec-independent protein translocase protein TatC